MLLHTLTTENLSQNGYQREVHWSVVIFELFSCHRMNLPIQKLLQDTVDEVRNYILEQRVQMEAKSKILQKSKALKDRVNPANHWKYHERHKRTSACRRQITRIMIMMTDRTTINHQIVRDTPLEVHRSDGRKYD